MVMDCAMHDVFEAAATLRRVCRVCWRKAGQRREMRATPLDWSVRDGEEWGVWRAESGELVELRLADVTKLEMAD